MAPFGLGRLDPNSPLAAELISCTDTIIDVGSGADPFLGAECRVESHSEGDVTVTLIHTPKGTLTQRYKRTKVTSAPIEYPLKGPEDVERFLSIPYRLPEPNLSHYHEWRSKLGDEGLVMVAIGTAVCLPASWFSPQDFCLMWADHPNLVEQLTATASERLIDYVEKLCLMGVEAFRLVGGEYVTVQLGPKGFERLVRPFDTELIRTIHKYGAVAHYHNHGPLSRWLELVADLGMDSLDPLEAPPWGDVEMADAKKRIGGRVCLLGNLDDMEVLDKLPEEKILRMGAELIEEAGPDGFILGGTTSGTYGEHAAKNFIALARLSESMATGKAKTAVWNYPTPPSRRPTFQE